MDGGGQEFTVLQQRIRQRSEDAVRQLIDRYGTSLLKAIRARLSRNLRREFDSDDFVQKVWTSFFEDPEVWHFETPEALVAYLSRIARNQILDEVRRRRPGRDTPAAAQSLTATDPSFGTLLDVPSRERRPISTVANREMLQKMRDGLDEEDRRTIDLVLQGFTHEEVARQVGCSVRRVGRIVKRARRILDDISEELLP
jgi:RNA polymerase sigma factor (sigma-70 family)